MFPPPMRMRHAIPFGLICLFAAGYFFRGLVDGCHEPKLDNVQQRAKP